MWNFISSRSIYIFIMIALIGLSIFEICNPKKKYNFILLITALLIFSIFGICRSNSVGLDTLGYSANYIKCKDPIEAKKLILDNKPEFLFFGLMYIFSSVLSLPEIVFYIFEYLFISVFLFLTFYKKEKSVFKLSIMFFIGIFSMSYSGIRQTMAMAIMIFAIDFLYYSNKGNIWKVATYYSLLIFATLFHSSSLMLAFVPILLKFKLDKFNFAFLLPILLFIPQIFRNLFTLASTIFYVYYSVGTYRASFNFIFYFLVLVALFAYFAIPQNSKIYKKFLFWYKLDADKEMSFLIWNVYFALIFMSCNVFSLVVPRYAMYFYFGIALFISKLVDGIQLNKIRFGGNVLILLIFGFYFIATVSNLGLVPYRFIF